MKTTIWEIGQPLFLRQIVEPPLSDLLDWKTVVGVHLMSRFPRLSFLDFDFKDGCLHLAVDINEAVITYQVQRWKEACLHPGCHSPRGDRAVWCPLHSANVRDKEAAYISRCLQAKRWAISLKVAAEDELQLFLRLTAIPIIAEFKTRTGTVRSGLELRQVIPHHRYEVSPTDVLSPHGLATLPFVLTEKQILPGYNFVAYGEGTSVYVEFDSHSVCPAEVDLSFEWYGSDESETKAKSIIALSLKRA